VRIMRLLVCVLPLLLALPARGQLSAEEVIRRNSQGQAAAATAQVLAAKSQWKEAEAKLQEAERQCGTEAPTQPCRLLLTYSMAWVAQQQGDTDRARTYYQRVLKEAPSNGAALNNLALLEVAAGHGTTAEALWTRAIDGDPQHAGQWALQLGEYYSRNARYSDALRQYQVAANRLPDAETPRRRIVESYVRMPDGALNELATQAFAWEPLFPSTTRIAYELLVKRGFAEPSSDQILLRWISLISEHDRVTEATLAIVPEGWKTGPVGELRSYLKDPTAPGFQWGWWRQSPARISGTLELASATGKQLLRETRDATRTASCWESALNWVSTPDMLMDAHNSDAPNTGLSSFLDLTQNLASLYYHYPSLDPTGRKLDRIVRSLFESKGMYISRGDWEATQNYHTTLALIYADRGIWNPKSDTFYAAGAIFQLRAALDDANRRFHDPQQKFFQPLPELKEKLAEGYVQTNQSQRAAAQYLSAAAAYLDVDALDAAQKTLSKARELGSSPETTRQLTNILDTRQKLLRGTPVEVSPEKTPWLFQPAGPIDQEFLKRQTFKISVDSAISRAGDTESAQAQAIKAYQFATQQQVPLVGAGDLVRWRRLESQLRANTNTPDVRRHAPAFSEAKPSGKSLQLTIPGHSRAAQVELDPQLSKKVMLSSAPQQ